MLYFQEKKDLPVKKYVSPTSPDHKNFPKIAQREGDIHNLSAAQFFLHYKEKNQVLGRVLQVNVKMCFLIKHSTLF